MDRVVVYPNALPRALDVLRSGQYAMTGLAKLAEATLGTSPIVDGLTCTPTNPASLTVNIAPGQVYQQGNLELTAISSLQADGTQLQKQGLLLATTQLTFAPTLGVGQSACYLIQVQYADSDTGQTPLNFYNAANPKVPLVGPTGNGEKSVTIRAGAVGFAIKPGTPTNGIPSAPTPDAGYVGLFVVTLSYNQTQIQAGNIAPYAAAPVIPEKLPFIPAGIQANKYTYVRDTGVADTVLVAPSPALKQRVDGTELLVLIKATNITNQPTINDGLGTCLILKKDGSAPAPGDLIGGVKIRLISDGANYRLAGAAASEIGGNSITTQQLAVAQPIYPEINAASGTFSLPSAPGQVTIGTAQTWQWRGLKTFSTASFLAGLLTFATQASKTYHLIWDASGTGLATPASTYPNGLFSLIDRTAANPVETDPVYDSTYDRMLIGRVVTDGSNNPTVTPLINRQFLAASFQESVTGAAPYYSGPGTGVYPLPTASPRILFDCRPSVGDGCGRAASLFTTNWARTPRISPAFGFVGWQTKSAASQVQYTYQEGGQNVSSKVVTRYNTLINYQTDYNIFGILDANGNFILTNCFALAYCDLSANG